MNEVIRQIVLDTETTGLEPRLGHRVIEIGCVEMIDRHLTGNNFHTYLQPDRVIDDGAVQVHGITNEFLADKPRFAEIVDAFLEYVKGAELIIHNAPFDVGFINSELEKVSPRYGVIESHSTILDTLVMARKMHPGQKNSLDALCGRYYINNQHREFHGALLDAEILADVYLAMTGGQRNLSLHAEEIDGVKEGDIRRVDANRPALAIVRANSDELQQHHETLKEIDAKSGGKCVWLRQDAEEPCE
jgi:DNA polymerase-3 subunit epsilon